MSEYYEIYVGNLPMNVSNEQLRELFLPLGEVLHVWINRQFRTITYAFVGFSDLETCHEACKRFDNYELGLSKLKVKMSFKNEKRSKDKSILMDLKKKSGMTKEHRLRLKLMENLRENRDIRESFKTAMQEVENVTDSRAFEVVKHLGEPSNLETLEETVIRNFKKPQQKKPIFTDIDIDLTKEKRLSMEQHNRLFKLEFETTKTTETSTTTKAKQHRGKVPVSMDYRSVCD